MTEKGGPKLMQNVAKTDAKCSQERMKKEKHCLMYSKNNEKCSPKLMQNVVQNE